MRELPVLRLVLPASGVGLLCLGELWLRDWQLYRTEVDKPAELELYSHTASESRRVRLVPFEGTAQAVALDLRDVPARYRFVVADATWLEAGSSDSLERWNGRWWAVRRAPGPDFELVLRGETAAIDLAGSDQRIEWDKPFHEHNGDLRIGARLRRESLCAGLNRLPIRISSGSTALARALIEARGVLPFPMPRFVEQELDLGVLDGAETCTARVHLELQGQGRCQGLVYFEAGAYFQAVELVAEDGEQPQQVELTIPIDPYRIRAQTLMKRQLGAEITSDLLRTGRLQVPHVVFNSDAVAAEARVLMLPVKVETVVLESEPTYLLIRPDCPDGSGGQVRFRRSDGRPVDVEPQNNDWADRFRVEQLAPELWDVRSFGTRAMTGITSIPLRDRLSGLPGFLNIVQIALETAASSGEPS